ncbi:synaptotagmin-1 [Latimeria chalumnae]|uniref:synaptotagmin-1 n=1 Tax=Latimeria chalumnae TaxID=7897 RepID=UPI00313B26B0
MDLCNEKSQENTSVGKSYNSPPELKHNYNVQKVQEEIEKLSLCLSPTPSISDYGSLENLDADSVIDAQESFRGRVRFSLFFDRKQSQLTLTVIEAMALPSQDFSQSTDPFIKIKLLSRFQSQQPPIQCVLHEWETKVVKNTRNPTFGDQFTCSIKENELKKTTVKFEVKDFDKYSRHSTLGEVRISLSDLNLSETLELLEDVQKRKKDAIGEILVSLKYLPTSQRIEVGVLKVKTAPSNDGQEKDVYARIDINCNQRRLKHQKSSLKFRSDIIVFNEVLVFNLLESTIKECLIAISIYESPYENESGRHLIGRSFLGKKGSIENDHWELMMQTVRQPVAKWHLLLI